MADGTRSCRRDPVRPTPGEQPRVAAIHHPGNAAKPLLHGPLEYDGAVIRARHDAIVSDVLL